MVDVLLMCCKLSRKCILFVIWAFIDHPYSPLTLPSSLIIIGVNGILLTSSVSSRQNSVLLLVSLVQQTACCKVLSVRSLNNDLKFGAEIN